MIRHLPIFIALMVPLIGAAATAEKIVDARLTKVTVFADRAEVVRQSELELPVGTHTLVFADLPAQTDRGSLQVEGSGGFVLQDVRFETRQLSELPQGRLKELSDELEKNVQLDKSLRLETARLKDRRTALEAIIKRVTTPPTESTEPAIVDIAQWTSLLNFYNTQLEQIDQSALENAVKIEAVGNELSRVRRDINQLNAKARKVSNTARVLVALEKPAKVTVELKSIVHGPGWSPSYDIRANTVSKNVAIASYGNVFQNTGEDWNNVELSLSTAQPQVGGREPELHPWFIGEAKPVQAFGGSLSDSVVLETTARARSSKALAASSAVAVAAAPEPEAMRVAQAAVQSGATAVAYRIPGDVSISSDNQPVRVAITMQEFAGAFRYSAVPKLSPHVYLKTKITNTSDYAFLPGPSNIYLDGSFVGNAQMDLVQPGKEFWTWLGIDQGVVVERKLLNSKEGGSGFFSSSKSMTYRYEFEIRNNKQQPVELVVWDQLPISQLNSISVELLQPKYTADTDALKMTSEKYIEWFYKLAPKQELKVPFEFRVSWPENTQVFGL